MTAVTATARGREACQRDPLRGIERSRARARTALSLATADDRLEVRLLDLLTDLRHLAAGERIDFDATAAASVEAYAEETRAAEATRGGSP